ncbi:MAG: tRNA pseudouridine(38-40) synthase TruA [Halobacteriales archaeon]|nr:tRNA pseudouridine(38-40) synthase TruA [Halobacteriales archaeon]
MPDATVGPRAFRVAYDGRPYYGFQRQPDVPTVEDTLFGALSDLGVCKTAPSGYSAAGRTDAGASAIGQTVVLRAPDWLTPRAFNGELPETVKVWASADVEDDFHARHDATTRIYAYHLHAPAATTDDAAVREAATQISGKHDFHNLTPDTDGSVRELSLTVERDGDFLVIEATAGGFPRHLVRRIAGLLSTVGDSQADLEWVDRVLGPTPIDGPEGVPMAQASGLLLRTVTYPTVTFAVDERAAADARSVFASRRVVHATRERVAGDIQKGI